MKKTILLGSIFSVFLLLMIPNVSAIEYKTIVENNQLEFNNELKLLEKTINNIENRFKNIKESIKNVDINIGLIIQILIKGIIMPIILYTLTLIPEVILAEIAPILGFIISTILGNSVMDLFLIPVRDMILEETGRFLISAIIGILLFIIDLRIANYLISIIFPRYPLNN